MYENPYQDLKNGQWYKTNFHTHAGTGVGTCGSNPIDKVVETYVLNKFDMLCISNHDIFTDTSEFTTEKITMIPGVEYSVDEHMLTIGVNKSLHQLTHQQAIDATKENSGFTIICHPNWQKIRYWSYDKLENLRGFAGIEVINMLIYRLNGSGLATDTWDHLLSQNRLIYGFGNDDFHAHSDAARSYNWIYCEGKNFSSMKKAVLKGAFCASTGLMPDYLYLEDNILNVKVKFPDGIYPDKFIYRFMGNGGEVLSVQEGNRAQYKLSKEKYVRVEALGENGALLFFQPVYDSGVLKMID